MAAAGEDTLRSVPAAGRRRNSGRDARGLPVRWRPLMLSRLDLRGTALDLRSALSRSEGDAAAVTEAVRSILDDVRRRGDDAVRGYTERFDGCRLDTLRVAEATAQTALDGLEPDLRAALEFARDQILSYHESQRSSEARHERSGVEVREMIIPVDRAGLYVPGGRAAYPSTVLMTAIPALVAGVREVAICIPPDRDGQVPATTLAAASLAGVHEVYRIGGAQAIGAMAYGTESVGRVDVIVGPGNAFVAAAKREVAGVVGIESLAGPSEVALVVDATADPVLVAADLLAQAEHGPGGTAVVIAWDSDVADAIDAALDGLLAVAPRRAEAEATLASGGRIVIVEDARRALDVANAIAPEHLELFCDDADALVPMVRNAGAVFCGPWAPAVIGDYVAGVNHVLPTGGTARFASALRVSDFQKHVHVVHLDEEAFRRVAPYAALLADAEGLDGHARSIRIREAQA